MSQRTNTASNAAQLRAEQLLGQPRSNMASRAAALRAEYQHGEQGSNNCEPNSSMVRS
jgi:hypothetical protein